MGYILDFNKWTRLYESETEYTTAALGDTNIYVAYGDGKSSFAPEKDMSYIVVGDGSIEFAGNRNNKIRKIYLYGDDHEYPGIRQSEWDLGGSTPDVQQVPIPGFPNPKPIALPFSQSMNLMPLIITALYGSDSTGASLDRLKKAIKAILLVNRDYPTYVDGNTLFSNLVFYLKKAGLQKDINALATAAKVGVSDLPGATKNIILASKEIEL